MAFDGAVGTRTAPAASAARALELAVQRAREGLLSRQHADGHWLFELEADCTIPAEFIMMMHFLDEIDGDLERKLAVYLRERQAEHGGWPLYRGGAFDISGSLNVYYALKLAGDSPQAPHMRRARSAILEHGGAARANVFTRITLAMFQQLPWRGVPYIPVEIMLLPRWSPFHLDKVSYWSRTVMVPLLILCTRRAVARNPRAVHIRELFTVPPEQEREYFRRGGFIHQLFLLFDRIGRSFDPWVPGFVRRLAERRAERWILERLNGEDGLGGIFPAMVNALEVMVLLGYPKDDPRRLIAKRALQKLLVVEEGRAYCQPCLSPVWDTALACLALEEEGSVRAQSAAQRAFDWLAPLQLHQERADWRVQRPGLGGGGWAFQYRNDFYPDLDDTAAVGWAMQGAPNPSRYAGAVPHAIEWLLGMQCRNGGFAAFDVDNTCYYLNEIPFADHGALLDPPTADVTARVVTLLARAGRSEDRAALERAMAYLRLEQEAEGGWFGRWGSNYVYGTWSVLTAFGQAGIAANDQAVVRAVQWLERCQRADGGWGESSDSYEQPSLAGRGDTSTPYHTAWALLALMAGPYGREEVLRRGVDYLLRMQGANGFWSDEYFNAPGFPRVFYLRYHGYGAYFPLWALARYRRLRQQAFSASSLR